MKNESYDAFRPDNRTLLILDEESEKLSYAAHQVSSYVTHWNDTPNCKIYKRSVVSEFLADAEKHIKTCKKLLDQNLIKY